MMCSLLIMDLGVPLALDLMISVVVVCQMIGLGLGQGKWCYLRCSYILAESDQVHTFNKCLTGYILCARI